MRIAVDIGFGFIKAMNEKGKQIRFPSVLAKRTSGMTGSLRNVLNSNVEEDYVVNYWENGDKRDNEKKLFVGEAGMINGGTRRWEDKEKFNVEDLKIFIATATGLICDDEEDIDLCVGLPMTYYLAQKDELVKTLQAIDSVVSYAQCEEPKKIKFKSVFCFPQGAGAYYSAVFKADGEISNFNLANSSVGVIDIGYRTVDYLIMAKGKKGITMIEGQSGSLEDGGMNKAFQKIEEMTSAKVGAEIGLAEIEKAILWRNGQIDYRKESFKIKDFEKIAYSDLAEDIASKIKIKWGKDGDFLSTILITGGGGQDLFPVLKTKFEQAELQEDYSFANCKGYLGAQARKLKKGE